jgi:hypothetical protein
MVQKKQRGRGGDGERGGWQFSGTLNERKRTSGTPNRDRLDATMRSHASTISSPPASAGPSTAAINGFFRLYRTTPANPPLADSIDRPALTCSPRRTCVSKGALCVEAAS